MSNLQSRQEKIQAKRKQTPRREFVMGIASWTTLSYYRNNGISRYPKSNRVNGTTNYVDFFEREAYFLDDSSSFFSDIQYLFQGEKLPTMLHYNQNENASFSDQIQSSQNIYLSTVVIKDCENVLYSLSVKESSKDVVNSIMVWDNSQNVYQSIGVINSSNIFQSKWIFNSYKIYNSTNLVNCRFCIGCSNLDNQEYYVDNTYIGKEKFDELVVNRKLLFGMPTKSINLSLFECNFQCEGLGKGILNYQITNGNNLVMVGSHAGNENMYDIFTAGAPYGNDYYGVMGVGSSDHIYCSTNIAGSSSIYYSMFLVNCSFCLGCIGLKNKSYCILNKQYTKEERYEKVDEIFTQMEKDGQLGEFFPATMNPFYFNDTAAYLIDPSFTKEEVTARGYLRRDEPIKVDIPEGMEIVKTSELGNYEGFDSEGNRSINADILKKVIQDEEGNVYRIIPMEYKFLVKHGLPLPRKHWLERMKENFRIS